MISSSTMVAQDLQAPGDLQPRICQACDQSLGEEDLTPSAFRLCQGCMRKRRSILQALEQAAAAKYCMLRPPVMKPCILQGLVFAAFSYKRNREACVALGSELQKADFPFEEAWNILFIAIKDCTPAKRGGLMADTYSGDLRPWKCEDMREKLGIDCRGCLLEYYQATKL